MKRNNKSNRLVYHRIGAIMLIGLHGVASHHCIIDNHKMRVFPPTLQGGLAGLLPLLQSY